MFKALSAHDLRKRIEVEPDELRNLMDVPHPRVPGFIEAIPFTGNDCTAGTETELQAAVVGNRNNVDLALIIEKSNYFANIIKRAAAGDTSNRAITDLEHYLAENAQEIWENSWVRFPASVLSPFARATFEADVCRDDQKRFKYREHESDYIRVPISYLIKLSLADVIGSQINLPESIRQTGIRLMGYFLNDNSSPETLSFNVVSLSSESTFGRAIARETAKRYLLTQLLTAYANNKFDLINSGQTALVYFSPHPPIRQKKLNECISDSFYRELFMSPCLSGWENGSEKHQYMCLCHQVLSRSQLNGIAKLKDAGIITRNLAVLPNISNTSLANNGLHLSLGSRKITDFLANGSGQFNSNHEKYVGDLVIKIVEHFLPLFVGTYSAAPYRLSFGDFHPERVLGFLPHELDYTHLRMIWRRWKKKAHLQILGNSITPFGIDSLDQIMSKIFRLKGDFVPDFRLLDYLVCIMSTDQSPALDGKIGNAERLKSDLAELGIFDERMPLYLLYRLREYGKSGFFGFEGRHYSLFHDLDSDISSSAAIQALVTAFAFKLILKGSVTHAHIPDSPIMESERRQIFFASAIGLPTFYIRASTENQFLLKILEYVRNARYSRRYPGYMRIYRRQYMNALVEYIQNEGCDLIEMFGLDKVIRSLKEMLMTKTEYSAAERLTRGVTNIIGVDSPMDVDAVEFNFAAEEYYRTVLRQKHVGQGLSFLRDELIKLESNLSFDCQDYRGASGYIVCNDGSTAAFLDDSWNKILHDTANTDLLLRTINLILLTIHFDTFINRKTMEDSGDYENYAPSICG